LSRFFDRQTIAQAVQDRAQSLIGAVPIGARRLRNPFPPRVDLLNRLIKHFETGGARGGDLRKQV
jgi:hypothetical protein